VQIEAPDVFQPLIRHQLSRPNTSTLKVCNGTAELGQGVALQVELLTLGGHQGIADQHASAVTAGRV